jgi:fatty acid-binding protein DegV
MRRTAVVTASAATLPRETAERNDISIVPLLVTFGAAAFRDGVDLCAAEF